MFFQLKTWDSIQTRIPLRFKPSQTLKKRKEKIQLRAQPEATSTSTKCTLAKRGYVQTGSKAHLPAFLQFSTYFSGTLIKRFFFGGRLNDAFKFELKLLHLGAIIKKINGAFILPDLPIMAPLMQIWMRHSNGLEKRSVFENFRKISQKLKKRWQMYFRA